ncbi:MAG: hypothetical protein LBB26_01655 [Puniceicoccales bacterium]|jgi:hypothetical protein|nr:hypothetical protein [Puniceicoccales bacterium]
MKNTTNIDDPATDIFNGDWGPKMFPVPRLTPGFKLGLPFLWEFSAFLEGANPPPAARAIWEISP